jgi:hypothetical protein
VKVLRQNTKAIADRKVNVTVLDFQNLIRDQSVYLIHPSIIMRSLTYLEPYDILPFAFCSDVSSVYSTTRLARQTIQFITSETMNRPITSFRDVT